MRGGSRRRISHQQASLALHAFTCASVIRAYTCSMSNLFYLFFFFKNIKSDVDGAAGILNFLKSSLCDV